MKKQDRIKQQEEWLRSRVEPMDVEPSARVMQNIMREARVQAASPMRSMMPRVRCVAGYACLALVAMGAVKHYRTECVLDQLAYDEAIEYYDELLTPLEVDLDSGIDYSESVYWL